MAKFIETISNQFGDIVPGATVKFYSLPSLTLAATHTADADGMVNATIAEGSYNIEISGAGITTKIISGWEAVGAVTGVPGNALADAGKVLTAGATAGAVAWQDVPEEVPDNTVAQAGNLLSAGPTANSRVWITPPLELPANATTDLGKVLTAGATANSRAWTTLSIGVEEFSATAAYALNDLVSYQGDIYRARGAVAAGAWNATQWEEVGAQPTFATAAEIIAGTVADHPIAPDQLRAAALVVPTATPANDANHLVRLDASGHIDDGFINFKTTTYRGNLDLTAAYVAPATAWSAGDFGVVSTTGTLDASWQAHIVDPDPTSVNAGDVVIFDGANYHVVAATAELTDYVKKAGDSMTGALTLPAQTGAGVTAPTALQAINRGYADATYQERVQAYTVATLPAAPRLGQLAMVTDTTGRVLDGSINAGGTVTLLSVYDGNAWVQA